MSIPVIMIAGHLGAGKTTLVNTLLAMPEHKDKTIALIINEFGTVSVDSHLIHATIKTNTYEINKGSIFCVCTQAEYIKTLEEIAQQQPDLVIQEATGLADPCDMEELIHEPSLNNAFHVSANITIVDVSGFSKIAAYARTAERQVAWADGIVMNKTDLSTPREISMLTKVLKKINSRAETATTINASIEYDFIKNLTHKQYDARQTQCAPSTITATTIPSTTVVSRDTFTDIITHLGEKLLRLKGTIDFGDGVTFIETVGSVLYPEKPAPENVPHSLTFITWDIGSDELRKLCTPLYSDTHTE